jgi:hypothetical protein
MEEIMNETPTNPEDSKVAEMNLEIHTLRSKLMQANQIIERLSDERALARVNFLFKVLKYSSYFPQEIIEKTTLELSEVMFPVMEEPTNE